MGRNSVVTENGGVYTIAQGTEEFADYRRWYLNKTKQALVFTDLKEVSKIDNSGAVVGTSDPITSNSSNVMTMCINRDESKAYVMSYWSTTGGTYITVLNISTMQTEAPISLGSISVFKILRAIISRDEKIVWLGDNGTLYVMDLDGSNLINSGAITSNADITSFAISGDNKIFIVADGFIRKYDFSFTELSSAVIQPFAHSSLHSLDSFILKGYVYLLVELGTTAGIVKIEMADLSNQTSNVISTTLSITGGTIAQFNASGADNFATFSCTIDTKQTVMQCNLDTLECMPARTVNYALRQIEYSNDTNKPIQRIGTDITRANNCDWKGLLTSSEGATGAV